MERKQQLCYWVLGLTLGSLALVYNAVGIYCLIADTAHSYPIDLRLRWVEQSLVYQGLNPQTHGHPDPDLPQSHAIMKNLGGSYPPWSYAINMLFVPALDWTWTRCYFALLNTIALFVIGFWANREGAKYGRPIALLSMLSVGAFFPLAICLSYGQLAILVTACLVAALALSERGYDGLAGLAMGVAFVKPQLAALFLFAFLLKKKWLLLLTTLTFLAGASCITWAATGCDPIAMLRGMSREAEFYYFLSHNPLLPLLVKLLGYKAATILMAASGIILCGSLILYLRERCSLLTAFSICAVFTMFWTYRKHYDCAILGFLIVSLLGVICRTRSKLLLAAFLLIGCSLWFPIRDAQWNYTYVQYGHLAVWIGGLLLLIFSEINRHGTRVGIDCIQSNILYESDQRDWQASSPPLVRSVAALVQPKDGGPI